MQNLLAGFLIFCVAGAASSSMAQGYSPGQTFSASPAQRPSATPTQQYQRTLPAQTATPTVRTNQPHAVAPLYNLSEKPSSKSTAPSRASSQKAATAPRVRKAPVKKAEAPKKIVKAEVTKIASTVEALAAASEVSADAVSAPTVATTGSVPLVINNLKTGKKLVALTYDDGPNPNLTPELVAYLKENQVPATFFVCGNMARSKPAMVKELADAGFELANHTYDHPNLNKLSREKILEQLQDTHDAVKEASGVDMRLMRPPFGAFNAQVRAVCENMDYKIIMWDVDTNDWQGRSAAQMINTIMKGTSDGSIILMHDRLHRGKATVMETTKSAVEQLRAKGYTFVTVGDMIAARERNAKADAAVAAGPAHVPLPTPAPVAYATSATLAVPIAPAQVLDILPPTNP